jgi:hypothetical protein
VAKSASACATDTVSATNSLNSMIKFFVLDGLPS